MEIQTFEYLKNEKSFLDEIKNIFHSFWRAIIWWKIKNCYKKADTSFKFPKFLEIKSFRLKILDAPIIFVLVFWWAESNFFQKIRNDEHFRLNRPYLSMLFIKGFNGTNQNFFHFLNISSNYQNSKRRVRYKQPITVNSKFTITISNTGKGLR